MNESSKKRGDPFIIPVILSIVFLTNHLLIQSIRSSALGIGGFTFLYLIFIYPFFVKGAESKYDFIGQWSFLKWLLHLVVCFTVTFAIGATVSFFANLANS